MKKIKGSGIRKPDKIIANNIKSVGGAIQTASKIYGKDNQSNGKGGEN